MIMSKISFLLLEILKVHFSYQSLGTAFFLVGHLMEIHIYSSAIKFIHIQHSATNIAIERKLQRIVKNCKKL